MEQDEKYMRIALKEAQKAYEENEVPIGAVIVKANEVIAKAHNKKEKKQQAIAHAEMLAIEKACKKLGTWHLEECTLYVTIEPCAMCAGAIMLSRIDRVVYGAKDPKGGCIDSCIQMYEQQGFNHYPMHTSGVLEMECSNIMSTFFKERRIENKQKKQAS